MCTAVNYKTKNHYFGRNLDLEYSYDEVVTITPRAFAFPFRKMPALAQHYAIIGMATVADGYPLYYDATNEKGLSMAALHFPESAVYAPLKDGKDNIAPFEFIPWLLGQCASVRESRKLLEKINLAEIHFSKAFPLSPLHWILSDKNESITVEAVKDGLKIYENPVGILTNEPPFDFQMTNLRNYMHLTRESPESRFSDALSLTAYSRGMGAFGLPGDLSSTSRFVRAAFTAHNSVSDEHEDKSVSQFFHILDAVAQTRGCVRVNDAFEKTVYSSCCNTDKGIYYYTTYENRCITAVDMHKTDLDANVLTTYPLRMKQNILYEN